MELFINATTGKPHARFIRKHILVALNILANSAGKARLLPSRERKPRVNAGSAGASPSRASTLQELSIALVGDKKMGELHEQFMGIPGPTDVLTFPLETDERGKVVSGEVIVCVSEAKRQAAERGRKVEHEILLYCLHGLLHLCGYDDRTARDFRRMHRAEDMILTQLGIGPVYADASPKPLSRSTTRRASSRRGARR